MPCTTLETRVPNRIMQPLRLLAIGQGNRQGLPNWNPPLANLAARAGPRVLVDRTCLTVRLRH